MDSTKIGPNVPGSIGNNVPAGKAKGAQGAAGIGQADNTKKAKGGKVEDNGDYNVNVSGKAKEMNDARLKALDIARNTPDVREDKVAELKKKIESGEYKVSSENIADGILREAIKDELAKEPQL